jgi:hypothetical protein
MLVSFPAHPFSSINPLGNQADQEKGLKKTLDNVRDF